VPCFEDRSLLSRWKCRRCWLRISRLWRRCWRGRRCWILTSGAGETSTGTVACGAIHSIDTSTTIGTTRRRAVVDVGLTSGAGEASTGTVACGAIHSIDTSTTIGTTRRRAIIYVGLTIGAGEASTSTEASVS